MEGKDSPSDETEAGIQEEPVQEESAQAITSTEKKAVKQSSVKKKRSAFHLLRVALVALFMLRHRSSKTSKSVHVEVASKGLWKRVLGSMRPLHMHDQQSQPAPALAPVPELAPALEPVLPSLPSSLSVENFQEMKYSPFSPQRPYSPSSSSPSSSSDGTSLYASAENLHELGRRAGLICDDEIEDEIVEDDDGDEMIDAKAEAFIANFYQQLQLQRLNSMKLRYNR